MKRLIKRLYYKLKYRHLNIQFGKSCNFHGFKAKFEGNNNIDADATFGGSIGRYSYIGPRSCIKANIGRFCSIASDVHIIGGKHPTRDWVSTHPAFYSTQTLVGATYAKSNSFVEYAAHPTTIGNDVWIGAHALLIEGICIGDGAIIAAGAVVTKDVPPYAIVGGIPAKIMRKRFTDEQIAKLLKLQWWNKDEAWLKAHVEMFANIDHFLANISNNDYPG